MGKTTTPKSPEAAADNINGYSLAKEVSRAGESCYGPGHKAQSRDGFLPQGVVAPQSGVDNRT
ncbi:4-hydroxyphenylacetate degradation protein, partial [Salmonella enterica subsp. enterica serovar Infantis]